MSTDTTACHRRVLAHSVQHRPIEGVFFGASEPERLNTLIIGAFHGDEGISTRLLERFIAYLQAPGAGSLMDFQQQPALIIPVLNPDGLARRTRVNANGVDLNRNYPTDNWAPAHEPGSPYDPGPAAASEPETRLVIDLIARYRPAQILTVHSPYKVLNFDGPARPLAEAMAAHSGYPVVADIGYATPGSFGTYAGQERQIPVVTLELPPGEGDPPHDDQTLGPESLAQIWQDNQAALEAAIRFGLG